jgi:hypothetical protein
MLVSDAIESMRQTVWAYKTASNNISPHINFKLLFMTGWGCFMRVYITLNVHVVEI